MSSTITMTGEEYDALHAEAEALRAENAKLRTALAEQGERQEAVASADDVRDACANAVSVFAEEANADQCREVAEYMREVLLAQIAHRQAQRQ